jgi:hypothetical protein
MIDRSSNAGRNEYLRIDRMRAHICRVLRVTAIPEVYYRALVLLRWIFRTSRPSQPHTLGTELVISLTSFPPRFPTLHLTIRSLLTQRLAPDRVILWLYAPDALLLPERVRTLTGYGLEIRVIDEDLRSYKKLVPALSTFPSDFLVTADDDLYYPESWLRDLVAAYTPGAKQVIGCRAHQVSRRDDGGLAPYGDWQWEVRDARQGAAVFLTAGAGALIPPGALPADALDTCIFMQLCPTADDVWVNFMLRLNGFSARKIARTFTVYDWIGTRESALGKTNVIKSGNDAALKAMLARYGDVFRDEVREPPSKAAAACFSWPQERL